MGLRLAEGVDLADIAARTGVAQGDLLDPAGLDRMQALGFAALEGARLVVSDAGMPLLDALLGELVSSGLVEA